jgi:hypothetical protein
MRPGDRSRTWFPELVSDLRASWRPDLTWDEIIALRSQLQRRLVDTLVSQGITPARVRCSHCGHVGPGAPPVITVRAVLLALKRFAIESEDAVRKLDKAWAKHRSLHQLDMLGQRVEAHPLAAHRDSHVHAEEA